MFRDVSTFADLLHSRLLDGCTSSPLKREFICWEDVYPKRSFDRSLRSPLDRTTTHPKSQDRASHVRLQRSFSHHLQQAKLLLQSEARPRGSHWRIISCSNGKAKWARVKADKEVLLGGQRSLKKSCKLQLTRNWSSIGLSCSMAKGGRKQLKRQP